MPFPDFWSMNSLESSDTQKTKRFRTFEGIELIQHTGPLTEVEITLN